jgi:Xaa-Pro dipeptidase
MQVVERKSYDWPFERSVFAERVRRLRADMEKRDLGALIVTEPSDIYRLTGYDTQGYWNHQALVVLHVEPLRLVCFIEEVGHAEARAVIPVSYRFGEDHVAKIVQVLRANELTGAVGVDASSRYLAVDTYLRLRDELPDVPIVNATDLLEMHRLIKTPEEISYLTEALRISNEVLRDSIDNLRIGVSDRVIAAQMSFDAIALGSDYFTQSPYVRFGPSMVEGHLTWQGRVLQPGDAVELEIAAVIRRYTAPIVRFAVAGPMEGRYRDGAEVALEGMRRVRTAMRPGVRGADVWAEAHAVAYRTGLDYLPGGYSVGVGYPPDWTESDLVTATSKRELRAGMVIHMVSFCQLPTERVGTGDVLLITDDGCVSLAAFPLGPGPFEVA